VAVKAKDYVFHPYQKREGDMKLNFRVNDTMHEISVDPRLTLLERDLR